MAQVVTPLVVLALLAFFVNLSAGDTQIAATVQ
jgi:hypothetical protein